MDKTLFVSGILGQFCSLSMISDLKVPYPVKDYSTAQSRMPHVHETLNTLGQSVQSRGLA